MITNEHNSMPYMRSLSSCLNRMITEGYTENFKVTDNGLESFERHYNYKPEDIRIINFFRFEGESDPADNSVVYLIEANDGLIGYSLDAYGAYSDHEEEGYDDFIRKIPVEERDEQQIFQDSEGVPAEGLRDQP